MEQWKKNLYITLAVAFVGQASFTLVTPFLPYVLKSMNVQGNLATWSGMAYSASFLTSAIMAPVWGSVSDRYGKKIQILRSGVGIAITYALYPSAKTPMQFVLLRGLTGFLSGFIPAATSLIATNTPESQVGYALGVLQAANAAGTIGGPLLGGLMVSALGIAFTFRLSAVVLFSISLFAFFTLKEEVTRTEGKLNVLADVIACLRISQLVAVLACLFLVQSAVQMTQSTLVLYIDLMSKTMSSTLVSGIIYAVAGAGTVLGASLAARSNRSSRPSPDVLFLMGLAGCAISIGLHGLWVNLFSVAFFRFWFGCFSGILAVSGNVLAAGSVSREFRGRAFGVLNGITPLGSVLGPVIGGALGDRLGLGSSFLASSATFVVAMAAFSYYRKMAASSALRERSL